MISTPTILILAGGKGTRLAGLYPELPKPLVPAFGKPFLYWLIRRFMREGCRDFIFSLGHKAEKIEEWLKEDPLLQDISWKSFTETQPLGTGGGAISCLPLCSSNADILVTNGDSLLLSPLAPLWETKKENEATLQAIAVPDTSRYGSLKTDTAGHLTGFYEKRAGTGLINGGLYLFPQKMLAPFPTETPLSMEYDILPALIEKEEVIKVIETPADTPFIDIGTPETLAKADAFIEKNRSAYF